jgi:hypothetical protein
MSRRIDVAGAIWSVQKGGLPSLHRLNVSLSRYFETRITLQEISVRSGSNTPGSAARCDVTVGIILVDPLFGLSRTDWIMWKIIAECAIAERVLTG